MSVLNTLLYDASHGPMTAQRAVLCAILAEEITEDDRTKLSLIGQVVEHAYQTGANNPESMLQNIALRCGQTVHKNQETVANRSKPVHQLNWPLVQLISI